MRQFCQEPRGELTDLPMDAETIHYFFDGIDGDAEQNSHAAEHREG